MSEVSNSPSEGGDMAIRPPRPRRQLIIGAGATASLILTLANRPALAAKSCNHSTWISWKGWHSEDMGHCTGDSPRTWRSNAANLWAPSWGYAFTPSASFTGTFPACKKKGWNIKAGNTDTLDNALVGGITIQHGAGNNLQTQFPYHVTAALLNINFYGDRYGTSANAQTVTALVDEVAAALNTTDFNTGQNNINAMVNKYGPLNQA
jgi:hypothetical protein